MKPSSMSSSSTVPANRMPMAVRSFPAAAASSQSMIRSAMSAPYLEREEERARHPLEGDEGSGCTASDYIRPYAAGHFHGRPFSQVQAADE